MTNAVAELGAFYDLLAEPCTKGMSPNSMYRLEGPSYKGTISRYSVGDVGAIFPSLLEVVHARRGDITGAR